MAARSPLKSKPLRNPGQSVDAYIQGLMDDKALSYFMLPMFLWVLAGVEWYAAIQELPRQPMAYLTFAAAFTIFGGIRIWQLRRRIRALKLGRDGEMVVGQFLEKLREGGAEVFHDIPGDRGNIDHIIVSERGVFVVETKTLSKPSPDATISVQNETVFAGPHELDRNPIVQLRAQIAELRRVLEDSTGLKLTVRGAIVFPGWFVEPVPKSLKKDLWLLEPKALPAFLRQEPMRLRAEQVTMIAHHLSRHIQIATS